MTEYSTYQWFDEDYYGELYRNQLIKDFAPPDVQLPPMIPSIRDLPPDQPPEEKPIDFPVDDFGTIPGIIEFGDYAHEIGKNDTPDRDINFEDPYIDFITGHVVVKPKEESFDWTPLLIGGSLVALVFLMSKK